MRAAAMPCTRCCKTALSAAGYRKVVNIIELELVLREMETFGLMRDPERYHLTIYGTPSRTERVGMALRRPSPVAQLHAGRRSGWSSTRRASSAPIRRRCRADRRRASARSPRRTTRAALLDSLSDAQRREAVISTRTYGDIVTTNPDKVDPLDGGRDRRREARRERSARSCGSSSRSTRRPSSPALAEARLARVREGGIESLRFGWAGSTDARRPHYYRVQGPLPHRVRRVAGWRQPHPHRVARLHGRLRARASRPGARSAATCCATTTRQRAGRRTGMELRRRSDCASPIAGNPGGILGHTAREEARHQGRLPRLRSRGCHGNYADAARAAAGDASGSWPPSTRSIAHGARVRHAVGGLGECSNSSPREARASGNRLGLVAEESGEGGDRHHGRHDPRPRASARLRRRQGLRRRRNLVRLEARRTPRAPLTLSAARAISAKRRLRGCG